LVLALLEAGFGVQLVHLSEETSENAHKVTLRHDETGECIAQHATLQRNGVWWQEGEQIAEALLRQVNAYFAE